uniref:Transmembrane protein n=1 Tax=Pithovirus LCPAC103 TaxID=2506588 RepID=A0A481Z3G6_9VIRU|nr:MAG: hypothetical protein LCPAC103_01190 [Pithovirus LCPAC103]
MSTVVYPSGYPQYAGAPTPSGAGSYTDPGIFNDELFQSYWFWILLFIAIIALALAIGALIWIGTRRGDEVDLLLAIQESSSATTASDTFRTNEFDMYIGRTTVNLNLNIPTNDSNRKGRQIFVKNDGTGDITLDTRSLVNFNEGRIPNGSTVETGVYAEFVFIAQNNLLRLQ